MAASSDDLDLRCINTIRTLSMDAVQAANSGHPGTPMALAPVAYTLSAVAGVVYIVATVALLQRSGTWYRVAWATLAFELAGVLTVGTLSLVDPALFAHPSVWSAYGMGYLFIPLVLPVLGMIWLYRRRPSAAA